MFINCNKCCLKRFEDNNDNFIKITNHTSSMVYFVLQYTTKIGTSTRQSPPFGRGSSQRLSYTRTATNMALNIINDSSPTKNLICHYSLQNTKQNYYFNIIETPAGIRCVQD